MHVSTLDVFLYGIKDVHVYHGYAIYREWSVIKKCFCRMLMTGSLLMLFVLRSRPVIVFFVREFFVHVFGRFGSERRSYIKYSIIETIHDCIQLFYS